MKLAWATDLHLDHSSRSRRQELLDALAKTDADALVLTGDTGTASSVVERLSDIAEVFGRPVYFVLGNHDFYGGSIVDVRSRAARLAAGDVKLVYLHQSGVQPLSGETALVGVDGWGDARYGNWSNTNVVLNDFCLIEELVWNQLGRSGLAQALRDLGADSAYGLRPILFEALQAFAHVVVATHVPPFPESAWHEGKASTPDFAPYFACKATGDLLLEAATGHPHRQITVLCGHSHGGGTIQRRPNLTVITGPAEYDKPVMQPDLILP
jgi:3',5'-cyclic-AMP phosphodiesterase